MYEKKLTEDLRLRLSSEDMDFLRDLSCKRSVSVSECIRSIIGEYTEYLTTIDLLTQVIDFCKFRKDVQLSDILQQLHNYYYKLSLEPDYSDYQAYMNDLRFYICKQILQLQDDDLIVSITVWLRDNDSADIH